MRAEETIDLVGSDSAASLHRVMMRSGCAGTPLEFIEAVSAAYSAAQASLGISDNVSRFRREASHQAFAKALKQVAGQISEPIRILVLGCGPSFAGCASSYAEEMVCSTFDAAQIKEIHRFDLSRADLPAPFSRPPFDLVVSHSLLHFVPELRQILHLIQDTVNHGGCYIMAHEPNSRYWREAGLMEARRAYLADRSRNVKAHRWLKWRYWTTKLQRLISPRAPRTANEAVNVRLRGEGYLTSNLTNAEIARIVDPHRSSEITAGFCMGLNGLEPESLRAYGLSRMEIAWQVSYDHLGAVDYNGIQEPWGNVNTQLAARYPHAGYGWTAIWSAAR